jgi:nitrite reductase/ring-hydroxylating ferredoxin subunit
MAWQRVASISEIDADGVLGVDVDGSSVALYRLGNEVFATAGICTHALAMLSDGFVEDGKIECQLHQGQFDIRSGKALCAPVTEDLRTYAVKLEGDDVCIDMERSAASAAPGPNAADGVRSAAQDNKADTRKSAVPNMQSDDSLTQRYVWPAEGLTRIPDWVYTDQTIYEREVEKIFHGRTWNYVALECEVPKGGDFIRSNVGPTPVVVVRADDGSINVFENRCSHRAAEFCRELSGNVKEFVCPYHQWSYDLQGNLAGVPFRRGVNGKAACPLISTALSTDCIGSTSRATAASYSLLTSATWNRLRTISGRRCSRSSRQPSTAASQGFWAITATRFPAIGSSTTRISKILITPRCCTRSW